MTDNAQPTSTKPYLVRAIYEWCTDNGFTPYVAVFVNRAVRVPMEYVKNHEIVLNVSFEATQGLKIDNEAISFRARFAGTARDLWVPTDNIVAVYARENGQGMAFPLTPELQREQEQGAPSSAHEATQLTEVAHSDAPEQSDAEKEASAAKHKPKLTSVQAGDAHEAPENDKTNAPNARRKGAKPSAAPPAAPLPLRAVTDENATSNNSANNNSNNNANHGASDNESEEPPPGPDDPKKGPPGGSRPALKRVK
jgi:stringent starvation protein B